MTNVLIVEDEQAIRRFLRTALEGDGMRVFEAETLQRGLLEAATRKPDLIILDLGLRTRVFHRVFQQINQHPFKEWPINVD
ncbi:response regulator [Escherichia coli]|uniref:response regulator n=1 Tax=Escherichia coli TaxID=562 RepID=UPI0020189833|nr:response regulator [Escherichia coli]